VVWVQVDAVVTGADRVVANGDSANKIGTYMLSIVSHHHNIPFFIAAPTTTLDPNTAEGSDIVIEQRPTDEITHFKGALPPPTSGDLHAATPCT
jgi:methylthioribose-1-phosphate isomerase